MGKRAYYSDTPAPSKLFGCLIVGSHVGAQPVHKRCVAGWRLIDSTLRPSVAATCRYGILNLCLWGSYVRVWNTRVAESDSFAAAETAEVCVSAFSCYQRGWVFAAGYARGAGRLHDVLIWYGNAVGGTCVTDDSTAFSRVV